MAASVSDRTQEAPKHLACRPSDELSSLPPDFAALARAYGWLAACVERTEQFEPALHEALAAPGPTLLHLRLDPDVSTTRTTLSAIRAAALKRG